MGRCKSKPAHFFSTLVRSVLPATILFVAGCNNEPATPSAPEQQPAATTITAPGLDKSPMDMIYWPEDYPVLKMSAKVTGPPFARVIYSRPLRDGRTIFGDLIPYGSRWRLGANEATEIEFFKDVVVNGSSLAAGRYVLYCIPFKEKWTIIFNSDLYTWGLKINPERDVLSVDVPVEQVPDVAQVFTMEFDGADRSTQLTFRWENLKAALNLAVAR
jgi:hypothetical protein